MARVFHLDIHTLLVVLAINCLMATQLHQNVRSGDLVGRYDGEEFCLLAFRAQGGAPPQPRWLATLSVATAPSAPGGQQAACIRHEVVLVEQVPRKQCREIGRPSNHARVVVEDLAEQGLYGRAQIDQVDGSPGGNGQVPDQRELLGRIERRPV